MVVWSCGQDDTTIRPLFLGFGATPKSGDPWARQCGLF